MQSELSKLIEVIWEGPHYLNELKALEDNKCDYGLYQIYGRHLVYGDNVLLYIGKADRQTIGMRIAQEGWKDHNDASSIRIYAGRFVGERTMDDSIWSKDIDLAERLLIYVHKPARNSKSLYHIPNKELSNIHVLNWGDYGSLLPEVSGARWTNGLKSIEFDYYQYGPNMES